ncbi:hypothetical protein AB0P21_32755 [Kribbella sp. NPDC056861]|uniref:hypothetical protein n=1 Tax=Kribbella sp. NPDC056861 TaxID=3154857 RepID=UPI003436A345
MADKGSSGSRLSGQVMCLVGALVVGVVVALVAGLIGMSVYESQCSPDDECWALLGGLVIGLIAGAFAAAITVIVLAARAGVGVAFGVGAAIAFLLAAGANLGWGLQGWAPLLYFAAALALAAGFVLSQATGGWKQPKPVAIVLFVAILGGAAFPLLKQLNEVRQVQHDIESLVERPLQPTTNGTGLWSVSYGTTGIEYSVLEPERNGSRIAEIDVTLRQLPSEPAPCTGFADLAPASAKDCTELEPGLWRGRDAHKAHYWVRADAGQWAHVSSSHYVGSVALQNTRDARAEQVARSLKPGTAWPLAAAVLECGFCTPLA